MNRNEYTPSDFPERFEADGITVEYADLKEIQMGSPLIGRLSVNGVPLSGHFGGPPLLSRSEVYAPRFLAGERKIRTLPNLAGGTKNNASSFSAACYRIGKNRRRYTLFLPGYLSGILF